MRGKLQLRHAVDSLYAYGQSTLESYTPLLLDCVRANDVDQGRRLQSHMDLHFFMPNDSFLHNRLLHLYAKSGNVSDAQSLFDKMPHRDVISWNALLSAYAKLGYVKELMMKFNEMPCRDSVSFNTVIAGLAARGLSSEALDVFARMRREGCVPTDHTHVSVLNVCSRSLDLSCGKQIHGMIIVQDRRQNTFVWNALTDMYAKCGEVSKARWLFDRMPERNVVSWNSIISGYLKNGQPDKCIQLFQEMQVASIKPDEVTVSNVLGACFQSGLLAEANKVFSMTNYKDIICWTTMIVGLAQNGKEEDALVLFKNMILEGIKPDSFTISSVLSACAKLASLTHGKAAHGKALHSGIEGDLLVSSALVDMYCKCGVTGDASVVFNFMPCRNVVTWNSMIGGYAQNGQDLEALALYEKMLQENLKPDGITFVGVLSACSHAGLVEEGQRYFDSITERHALIPTLDHYSCMINLLGRSGCIDKAVDLINGMSQEPNALIWSTLLSVAALKRNEESAEMAARHLFKLEPLNAGPYIMLSNLYAANGRWKDVAYMRSQMKKVDAKKFAAYSWIQVDNEVHRFVSEDRTHPETEGIYAELGRLIKKLQEAGFTPDTNLVLHAVSEEEKFKSICYHSEKLALAFGFIRKPQSDAPIRIMKNIRVCSDCHVFMKFVSKITGRHITLRDSTRYHHFIGGQCCCKDYW